MWQLRAVSIIRKFSQWFSSTVSQQWQTPWQVGEWTSRLRLKQVHLGFENLPCTSPQEIHQAWSLEQYIPSSHSIFYTECESFFWPAQLRRVFIHACMLAGAKCNLLHFNISILTVHHFSILVNIWYMTLSSAFPCFGQNMNFIILTGRLPNTINHYFKWFIWSLKV